MYGRILRQLRESKGHSQAHVARAVSMSPAHLARLETDQRGLYVEDFVSIAEALGEKPGNLLPNDMGAVAHLKPLIDDLTTVPPELLPHVVAILGRVLLLSREAATASPAGTPRRRSRPAARRSGP